MRRITRFTGLMVIAAFGTLPTQVARSHYGKITEFERMQDADMAKIPARKKTAMGGRAFIQKVGRATEAVREAEIYRAVVTGNIPTFLRDLAPVTVSALGRDGKMHSATLWVMPDYLSVGSNADYVRIPMTPLTAQRIADKLGFVLPTTKIVDDIYESASVRVTPVPMRPNYTMTQPRTFLAHQMRITGQINRIPRGAIIAGIKKDIVITNRLNEQPGRVAIYGWHQPSGQPIQPLSLVHGKKYVDYSHGVRLVYGKMVVDGKIMNVKDVMKDPNLSPLLSDEGRMKKEGYL